MLTTLCLLMVFLRNHSFSHIAKQDNDLVQALVRRTQQIRKLNPLGIIIMLYVEMNRRPSSTSITVEHYNHSQSQHQPNPSFTPTWIGRFTFFYIIISRALALHYYVNKTLKKCFLFGRLEILLKFQSSTNFKCQSFTDFKLWSCGSLRLIENYRFRILCCALRII